MTDLICQHLTKNRKKHYYIFFSLQNIDPRSFLKSALNKRLFASLRQVYFKHSSNELTSEMARTLVYLIHLCPSTY